MGVAERMIAERAHLSSIARLRLIASVAGAETRTGEGWSAVRTGVDSNDFNGVISDRGAGISSSLAKEMATWVTANGRPASWLVDAPDPWLTATLIGIGGRPERTGHWCGADLGDVARGEPSPVDLGIAPVRDAGDLVEWLDLTEACGWSDSGDRSSRGRIFEGLGFAGALRHWIARVDGVPVGFASSMVSGAVVDLCNLGVLPSFRRRGIGRALALHRLRVAAAQGAEYAVAAPSQDGWELYRTLGFTLAPVVDDSCFYLERTAPHDVKTVVEAPDHRR